MSRYALAVLMLSAFVVLAGCGSGPQVNEASGGGFAAAPVTLDEVFVPADGPGDLVLDEPFDPVAASELPPLEVAAAASPLKLWLTGGAALKKDSGTGRMYYPMKMGESRPIRCTWSGGSVSGAPVWSISPPPPGVAFNAMRLPPNTLGRNFLYTENGASLWDQVQVVYGGQTQSIWVKVSGTWPRAGFTAPLNASGARLKVAGNSSVWSTGTQYGTRWFTTTQSGVVALRARIVGNYPNPPTPQWTAQQTKLKFVGSSTGWTIRFRIKERRQLWPLTAKIGGYCVTVLVRGA